MANVFAPFGFEAMGTASGPVNFAESHNPPYRILGGSSPYATQIFWGDLVRMNASTSGYVERWTVGDGGTATNIPVGIFVGCSYYSTSQQKTVFSRYWPGADASSDATAHVIDDPNAEFKVQAGTASTPITQASIGQAADIIATPLGSTLTGISGMSLGVPTASSASQLPFKVVNIINSPPGVNGTDITTAYNYVVVAFNNQMFKTLLGV